MMQFNFQVGKPAIKYLIYKFVNIAVWIVKTSKCLLISCNFQQSGGKASGLDHTWPYYILRQMRNIPTQAEFFFQMAEPGLPEQGQRNLKTHWRIRIIFGSKRLIIFSLNPWYLSLYLLHQSPFFPVHHPILMLS